MSISKSNILRLYKNILLYSKKVTLTDPVYFKQRVTAEFKKNKDLEDIKDITFAYQKGQALLSKRSVV